MIVIQFELPDNPTSTSQEKGINYKTRTVYTKHNISAQKGIYRFKLKSELTRQGIRPPKFEGCVKLNLYFGFKTVEKKKWGKLKATKPDGDNIAKLLIDVMADVDFFTTGDQQVCVLQVVKVWSEKPWVRIETEEVDSDIFRIQDRALRRAAHEEMYRRVHATAKQGSEVINLDQ